VKAILDTPGYSGLMRGDPAGDPAILEVLSQATQVFIPVIVLGEWSAECRAWGGF